MNQEQEKHVLLLKMTSKLTLIENNVSSTIDIDSINIMIDIGHGMNKYDYKNEINKNIDSGILSLIYGIQQDNKNTEMM